MVDRDGQAALAPNWPIACLTLAAFDFGLALDDLPKTREAMVVKSQALTGSAACTPSQRSIVATPATTRLWRPRRHAAAEFDELAYEAWFSVVSAMFAGDVDREGLP